MIKFTLIEVGKSNFSKSKDKFDNFEAAEKARLFLNEKHNLNLKIIECYKEKDKQIKICNYTFNDLHNCDIDFINYF